MSSKINKNDINSNNGSNGSKSIQTISSHKERRYDTIPFRLDFIKDILKDNDLDPIINFENLETESFIHPNGYSCIKEDGSLISGNENSNDDSSNYDIRL